MPAVNNYHNNELRQDLLTALQAFESSPLHDASIALLSTLGYSSDKTIEIPDSNPTAFLNLLADHKPDVEINRDKALFDDWLKADILFQLTEEELSHEVSLFKDVSVNPVLLQSYLFFVIELKQRDYARGMLTDIARQLNRVFPMPVMVFIKHGDLLSIAVINRRLNKRDAEKDVLGKVTIIRNISLTSTRVVGIWIFSAPSPCPACWQKQPSTASTLLHAAWEEIFNVELLNKRFYKELANWYFWALPAVSFPDDMKPAGLSKEQEADYYEKLRATGLIRLLTRLIFCWFLKEKGLIPESLFDQDALADILKSLDDDQSTYHQAILQNLFFATLNQRMNARGEKFRVFAKDEGFLKNRNTYGVDNLYRYETLFKDPEAALTEFEDIPFLNGGLFECLDRTDDNGKKIYVDGFSRNSKKRPTIPNRFFFGEGEVNIGAVTGETRRGMEKVEGLIHILSAYKFTIVENTPIDQEIALDPELLGKVFENLLASYNEETKTTARKQTGSFYTPRPIVDYMVDESLKAHLATVLEREHRMAEDDTRTGLDILFAYTEKQHPFEPDEVNTLIKAIDSCKILDPACGSGAFPMGMLHKLVYILTKLDPDNARWKQTQLDKLDSVSMREELERTFESNNDDYGRKLYLIENCLYGVDIQPIAIQLSKLRFFISLICDQKTNRNKQQNHGVRPLPNLETKFVAADTLIGLGQEAQMELFKSPRVVKIEEELQKIRHDHFAVQKRQQKLALQRKDKELRDKLADELVQASFADQETSLKLANWNPYDPHLAADFFEPLWMFDRSLMDGFDIVVGNPPYGIVFDLNKKKFLEAAYPSFTRNNDIYVAFYERALQLMATMGHLVYISPNTFLNGDYFKRLRKHLTSFSELHEICDFKDSSVFQDPTVFVCICRCTKIQKPVFPYALSIKEFVRVEQGEEEWCTGQYIVHAISESPLKIGDPIFDRMVGNKELCIIDDIFYVKDVGFNYWTKGRGKRRGGDSIGKRVLYSGAKRSPEDIPYIKGRDIDRWQIARPSNYLRHDYESQLDSTVDTFRFTTRFLEQIPKVVYRQTSSRIVAAIDKQKHYLDKTVHLIVPRESWNYISPESLLGLLNSRLFEYFYHHLSQERSGRTFAQVKTTYIKRLPIPRNADFSLVGSIVKKIVEAKASDTALDTHDLESRLDEAIYSVYGLTKDEIVIIEEEVTIR